MKPREADRIIKAARPVTVHDRWSKETFTATFVRRDRRLIESADGGLVERDKLEIIKDKNKC